MKRRVFLAATGSAITFPVASSSALASDKATWHKVDFEQLVDGFYSSIPDGPRDLRKQLAVIAHTIRREGFVINSKAIRTAYESTKTASKLARRTQFAIQILHNNGLGSYLDEAWVATVRSRFKVVTRFLPLVGCFNNLYCSAESLDRAVQNNWNLQQVAGEKFEGFAYALATFALEVGLWWVGAPYKMAWRGTRFVSNRTLLRVARYLDNRLIALLMSEIHWKVREKVYDEVSADNLQKFGDELKYIISEFDELQSFAVSKSVETDTGERYLRAVDLQMDESDLLQYDFIETTESGADDSSFLSGWGVNLPGFDLDFSESRVTDD